MPVITDAASAQVKRGVKKLYGTVLSKPALLVSDGINLIYACDVEIGMTDPTGRNYQYYNEDTEETGGTGDEDDDLITGLPGQETWDLDQSLMIDTTLHNVIISRGNADLIYADVGNPVWLERSNNGQWMVMGFSIEQPGTYTLIPVNLGNGTIGTVVDMSVEGHVLTLGELGTMKPFGAIPFGASAIFRGGVLQRVVV